MLRNITSLAVLLYGAAADWDQVPDMHGSNINGITPPPGFLPLRLRSPSVKFFPQTAISSAPARMPQPRKPETQLADVCYQVVDAVPLYPQEAQFEADGHSPRAPLLSDDDFFRLREAEDDFTLKLREDSEVKHVVKNFFPELFKAVDTASRTFFGEQSAEFKSFQDSLRGYLEKHAQVKPGFEVANEEDLANLLIFAWLNVPVQKQCEVRGNSIGGIWDMSKVGVENPTSLEQIQHDLAAKVSRGREIRQHFHSDNWEATDIRKVFGGFYVMMSKTIAVKEFIQLLVFFYPSSLLERDFRNLSEYKQWKSSWKIPLDNPYLVVASPANWAGMNFPPLPGLNQNGCRSKKPDGWRPARSWQDPKITTGPKAHTWTPGANPFKPYATIKVAEVETELAREAGGNVDAEVNPVCSAFCETAEYAKLPKIHQEACERREQGGSYAYQIDWSVWNIGETADDSKDMEILSPSRVVRLAGAPETAGPSGTTSDAMMFRFLLGAPSKDDVRQLRKAMLAWLVPMRDHSFVEVLLGAEPFVGEKDRQFSDCVYGLTLKNQKCRPATENDVQNFHSEMLKAVLV